MNLIKTILTIIVLYLSIQVFAQKKVEIYSSFYAFNIMKPDTASGILIERRTRGQIYMVGGNDYKIYSNDKVLSKKLKKVSWGIKLNDSIYLNCFLLKLGPWYAYAERLNDRLYFTAAITMDKEERQKLALIGTFAGPIGAGLAGGDLALKRFYYVLDLKTGKTQYLTKEEMLNTISSQPDLIEKYKKETEPEKIETIKYYLAELKNRF